MNLVADEGVDRPVLERLRQDGHDGVHVAEFSLSIADEEVLQQANARRAVLLTADKDFGELVFRQSLVHYGVVLLRLAGLANATKAEIVGEVFGTVRRNWSARSASFRPARFAFGGGHDHRDHPRGSNLGIQPPAGGRG